MPSMEAFLLAAGVSAGTIPVVASLMRAHPVRGVAIVVAVFVAASTGLSWEASARCRLGSSALAVRNRPVEVLSDSYVSSAKCRACHPGEYASWHDSYHRTMTQVASPQSVQADFNNVDLTLNGRLYQLERTGKTFWVNMDDPDASPSEGVTPRVRRRIVLTTGSHAMQAYWFESGAGRRLELLPLAYRIPERRWITDHGSFVRPPWPDDRPMPVAAPGQWNTGCISCHATRGQPRMAADGSGVADTHVAEFGIACEACHGPAEQHVTANGDPKRRYGLHLSGLEDPTIVQPERLSSRRSAQVCGQCHSVFVASDEAADVAWRERGYDYRPGDELTDTRVIVRGTWARNVGNEDVIGAAPGMRHLEDSFWSDGMVRVSGREYNGLIESPCFQRGEMNCLSCHGLHQKADDPRSSREWADDQLKPEMDSDQACLQCHESYAAEIVQHTHHAAGSSGSRCYNCHMPYTTYGLLKAIRSHQVDSPSVSASLQTGRPNACNQCHLDRTLAWTSEHLQNWYGQPKPSLTENERHVAASVLWALTGDAGQRALMAWSFGWDAAQEASGAGWMAPFVGQLLLDPYDAVRFIAARSLRTLPGFKGFAYNFLAPAEQRLRAAQRVPHLWRPPYVGAATAPAGFPAVLLAPDGKLRFDVVGRLAAQRDNRPMVLRE